MTSAKEVAEWMAGELKETHWLYQNTTVLKIRHMFGPEFVYRNKNGNPAISEDVLKHFRSITKGLVKWHNGYKAWQRIS